MAVPSLLVVPPNSSLYYDAIINMPGWRHRRKPQGVTASPSTDMHLWEGKLCPGTEGKDGDKYKIWSEPS